MARVVPVARVVPKPGRKISFSCSLVCSLSLACPRAWPNTRFVLNFQRFFFGCDHMHHIGAQLDYRPQFMFFVTLKVFFCGNQNNSHKPKPPPMLRKRFRHVLSCTRVFGAPAVEGFRRARNVLALQPLSVLAQGLCECQCWVHFAPVL